MASEYGGSAAPTACASRRPRSLRRPSPKTALLLVSPAVALMNVRRTDIGLPLSWPGVAPDGVRPSETVGAAESAMEVVPRKGFGRPRSASRLVDQASGCGGR